VYYLLINKSVLFIDLITMYYLLIWLQCTIYWFNKCIIYWFDYNVLFVDL